MIKRIDTSGRVVVRREHMDDDNDMVVMSVKDWLKIKQELDVAKALVSKANLRACGENVNVDESPRTITSKEN